jgi:hypothetical protein
VKGLGLGLGIKKISLSSPKERSNSTAMQGSAADKDSERKDTKGGDKTPKETTSTLSPANVCIALTHCFIRLFLFFLYLFLPSFALLFFFFVVFTVLALVTTLCICWVLIL